MPGYSPPVYWFANQKTAWRNIKAEFGMVRLAETMGPGVRAAIPARRAI